MPKFDNDTLLLAFVGVTAVAILLQTILLFAIFITVRKAAKAVKEEAEDLRSSLMPIIYNSRDLFTRLAPKFESTIEDLSVIASGLRRQTAEIESSALEIVERIRRQTGRLDVMATTVLDAVDRAGGFVAEMVSRPVRQVSSLMSSLKAILESLRSPAPSEPRSTHAASDKDMFV
jgi:methyl-accepting chemotaxis protein